MFLKQSLESKLQKSISVYESEEKRKFPSRKKKTNFVIHSKNETLNFPLDHKKFNDDDVSRHVYLYILMK